MTTELDLMPPIYEDEPSIDIMGESETPKPVDPAVAMKRAEKANFSLGNLSPGLESLHSEIAQGLEKNTREKILNLEVAERERSRQGKIVKLMTDVQDTGRTLDVQDFQYLNNIQDDKELYNLTSNPDMYFEKKYAKAMLDLAVGDEGSTPEIRNNPLVDVVSKIVAKQQGFESIQQDTEGLRDNQGFLGKASDFVEGFIPFKSWWNNQNAVKNAPTSSFLSGNNIEEQIAYLHSIEDPDQAYNEAKAAIDSIAASNLNDAVIFAQYLTSYGDNDKLLNNVFSGLDLTALAGVPGLRGGANTLRALATSGRVGATIPGVLDATGQTARAAFSNVRRKVAEASKESGAFKASINDITNEILPISNPASVLRDVGSTPFSREFAQRLEDTLLNQSGAFLKAGIIDPINITRIEPGTEAYRVMMTEANNLFATQYQHINDAVLSMSPIRSAENAIGNTDHIAVQLGRRTGELFDAEYEAEAVARLWGLKGHRIKARGDKFYIELTKAVDETLPSVRAALSIDTVNAETPTTFLGRFLGRARTRDDLVSGDINQELKIATYGSSQFSNLTEAIMAKAFNSLPRWRSSSRQDFMSFITMQRDVANPVTGARGMFNKTIGDFTSMWRTHHGRLPTELETQAYFTYVQASDAEYMLKNLNIYKGKSRLGLENWELKVGANPVKGIEGRMTTIDRMFAFDDDAGVMVLDDVAANGHVYYRKNSMGPTLRQTLETLTNQQGYRVVQISSFGEDALRAGSQGLPPGRINYVLVKQPTSSPLSLKQIPYRPGGHVEYSDSFFVSQANVRAVNFRGTVINDYYGDRTILSARTRQEAQRQAQLMEGGRLLLGDNQALRAYLQRNGMPYSLQEFTRIFDASRGGILDPGTPILARARGANLAKEHKLDGQYINFRDPNNTPHNLLNEDLNLQYALERNDPIHSFINYGTDQAPMYGLQPSRLLDPAATMARSNSNVARGRYLDDIKIKTVERFIAEFGDLIEGSAEELSRYPMRAFRSEALNKAHPDKERLATAMNYQRSMKEFFSMKDPELSRSETIIHQMYDRIVRGGDQLRAERVAERWTDSWLAHTIDDPIRFLRQVAFYPKMGFFNPKQLLMQAQGVTITAGIEGLPRTLNAFGAASLMRPLHLSNGTTHLNHIAQQGTKFGYRTAEHFKESYLALQRTGFQHVGGEYGVLDDLLEPQVFTKGTKKALDSSLYFFKHGERANRLTAWNASYMRWRDANPASSFNGSAIKEVLERADMLTMNMSRASNASWNQGISSVPTQFWSYQARLMDLMLGTRITPREKARLMLTQSALYGVPSGTAGVALGVAWPFHEEARKQLEANGYKVDNKVYQTFVDGIPQVLASMLTGGDGPNISETFGPSGNTFLKELLSGDKTVVEATTGASGAVLGDFLGGSLALVKAGYTYAEPMFTAIMGTGLSDDGVHYNVRDIDLKDALEKMVKPISSVSNAQKAFYAINAGEYLTKNGDTLIKDANGWQGFFTGILGTNPQEISDFYSKIDIKKGIEDYQRQPRQEAMLWLRRAYNPDISDEERTAMLQKAATFKILGKFTESQWISITKESTRTYQTEIEQIDERLRKSSSDQYNRFLNKILNEGK